MECNLIFKNQMSLMANVLLRELLVEWVNKGNQELLVMR